MSKTYTKEQLIKGMVEYYKQMFENSELFKTELTENFDKDAEDCIDYLLKIIDNEN